MLTLVGFVVLTLFYSISGGGHEDEEWLGCVVRFETNKSGH